MVSQNKNNGRSRIYNWNDYATWGSEGFNGKMTGNFGITHEKC
jgi:hypothetical protein